MGRMVGSVAEKLGDFKTAVHFAYRGWLCGADSQRACLADACGIDKRRPTAVSGLWWSHLYVYCWA